MKKVRLFSKMFLAVLVLIGCTKTYEKTDLPEAARLQLETSIDVWNSEFGTDFKITDWTYKGPLQDASAAESLADALSDETTNMFPSIDFGDTTIPTVDLIKITDDPSISASTIASWKDSTKAAIKEKMHQVELSWEKGGSTFTSTVVLDDVSMVYDNILMNASGVRPSNSCFSYKMWWIWEGSDPANWTRGKIYANVTPTCNNQGIPISCNEDCTAFMTAGAAKINCTSKIVDNCCVTKYSWAWACGFKSVKVATDGFTVEVTGYIGSSGSGNGGCTRCCEVRP
ncbi:MAG: hypothetical protein N4A46_11225 [Schleiferiaceae bacterium]|jgi:hypothetical protein|nr:hypothetical protein [Schleiferiaceae bacterium]